MTDPLKITWNGAINLPMLAAVIIGIASGAVYVNSKFDTLGRLVVETASDRQRIDDLEKQILINRSETLENRKLNERILERLK